METLIDEFVFFQLERAPVIEKEEEKDTQKVENQVEESKAINDSELEKFGLKIDWVPIVLQEAVWVKCFKCSQWRLVAEPLDKNSDAFACLLCTESEDSAEEAVLPEEVYSNLVESWKGMGFSLVSTKPRFLFYQKLIEHLQEQQPASLAHYPMMLGRDLDLFALYEEVTRLGGMYVVTNKQLWKYIAVIGFKYPRTSQNCSHILKKHYLKYLIDFENKHFGIFPRIMSFLNHFLDPKKNTPVVISEEELVRLGLRGNRPGRPPSSSHGARPRTAAIIDFEFEEDPYYPERSVKKAKQVPTLQDLVPALKELRESLGIAQLRIQRLERILSVGSTQITQRLIGQIKELREEAYRVYNAMLLRYEQIEYFV